jgi:hypothetical protein
MSRSCRVVGLFAVLLLAVNVSRAEKEKMKQWITPILPPIGEESKAACALEPDEARILRALPKTVQLPGIYEESRDNIQIVTERVVDEVDPPRCFPLVGKARLHHCQWRCAVYYDETIKGSYPFAYHRTQPRVQVVYIDLDHLHLTREAEGQ